jgi:hypothetical protein
LATKPFEPFKMQFLPFHYPQPVNLVVPESSGKGATNETTDEGDDVKSYVGLANKTAAADGDSEQMVAKEEAFEEHEEDAQVVEHVEDARVVKRNEVVADVESTNGEATDF